MVADECRVQEDVDLGYIWYKRNEYPEVKTVQNKNAFSFYGALDVNSGEVISRVTPWQNSSHTVRFLKQLGKKYKGKRVLIIWDGARWHNSKAIKKYLREKKDFKWLELMYFPAYSPELNPIEHVWREMKQKVVHNNPADLNTKKKQCKKFLGSRKFYYKLL